MNLLVALPYHNGDAALMVKNLRWQRELCGRKPHTAVICCDQFSPARWRDEIETAAAAAYANVLRYQYPPAPQNTWPQGPNWAFQHTATHMQQYKKPWLWLEADAIPLKWNWLEQLEAEYFKYGRAFMGSVVPEFNHMNGVGIYPHDTPNRIPRAMHVVDHAWDSEMREEMIADCVNSQLFCHAWGQLPNGSIHHRDGVPPVFNSDKVMAFIKPDAVLVHRDKLGLVIDRMRVRLKGQRSVPLSFCGENVPCPKVEIFIVSYSKDIEYLTYNLQSIRKFASGFAGVTLLVPTHERTVFADLAARFNVTLKHYQVHSDPEKWHLHHQLQKCRSDEWCPNADMVFHTDSDCLFTKPSHPDDFYLNGKPILCVEEFSRLIGCPWKPTVDAALGIDSQFETMRRHGATHYRGLYADVRKAVEKATGRPFNEYVLSVRGPYPHGFSEFNVIGNVVLNTKWKEQYSIVDVGREPYPPYPMIQFWSPSPPDQPQSLPSGGNAIPKEIIDQVLG